MLAPRLFVIFGEQKENSSSRHGDKEKKEADHHPRILEILS